MVLDFKNAIDGLLGIVHEVLWLLHNLQWLNELVVVFSNGSVGRVTHKERVLSGRVSSNRGMAAKIAWLDWSVKSN